MKGKMKFILPILLLVIAGGAYKFVLAKPAAEDEHKPKIEGVLVKLDPEFTVNLTSNQMAKVTVSLLIDPEDPAVVAAGGGGHGAAAAAPDLPQSDAIRSIISDALIKQSSSKLLDKRQRAALLKDLARTLRKETDTKVDAVYFTDIIVS